MRQNQYRPSISFGLKTISAAVASAVILLSGNAHAAGLGKLAVLSALGQPLRAEIELTSVSREEAGGLVAKLASQEAYRQANIDFNPALLSLRFAVEQRGERHVIKISSTQPMNEPYVDMLLELGSNNDRLVREYTFLLDPAELRNSQSAQVAAPVVVQTPTVRQAPVARAEPPAPREAAPAPAAPVRQPRRAEAPQPVREETAAPSGQAGEYQVKRGDTLARIAQQVKPAGVSLDQVLVALYRANPDAFVGNNMNRLRSGQILTVPDANTVRATGEAEAHKVVLAQANDFSGYRQQLAGQVARSAPSKAAESKQSETGKITSKVEETPTAASEAKDKLKLSKADAGKAGKSTAPIASAEDQIAKERALADANARVKELENNVAALQKALMLKNQEMAKIQAGASSDKAKAEQAAKAEQLKAEQAKAEAAKVEQAKAEKAKADAAKAEQAKADAAKAEAAKAEQLKAEQAKADAAKAEQAKAEQEKAAAAKAEQEKAAAAKAVQEKADQAKAEKAKADEPAKPADAPAKPAPAAQAEKPPAVAKPAPAPAPAPEASSDFLGDNLPFLGLGAILALLAGWAGYKAKKRKSGEKAAPDTYITETPSLTANSIFGATGGQSVDTNNSIFNSSFAPSASQLDTNEVDPIAEADVYIAYGRDEQAEEILKEALRAHPDRNAVRVKLLEIYASRKDVRAFDLLASDLYGLTKGEGEEWAHVASLGASIDPNNPLYAGGELPDEVAAQTTPLSSATQPLAELDPDALLADSQSRMGMPQRQAEPGLDIDQIAAQVAANGLDFDLSAPAEKASEPVVEASLPAAEPAEAKSDFADLDFDLSMQSEKPAAPAPEPNEITVDLNQHQDDLHSLDFPSAPAVEQPEPKEAASEMFAGLDFDLGDAKPVEAKLPEMAEAAADTSQPNDLDFNFDSSEISASAPAHAESVAARADEAPAFNFDFQAEPAAPAVAPAHDADLTREETSLPDLGFDHAGAAPAAAPAARPEPALSGLDLGLNGIDLNLDQDVRHDAPSPAGESLSSWDQPVGEDAEMATKLDLAAAYQEIGDKEGARELLDEVLKGGSAEQIEKANAMLKSLA